MRLSAQTIGDIRRQLRAERAFIEQTAGRATKEATNGLKRALREDVTGSGLGRRLANTWRSQFHNDRPNQITGFLYSRAPHIIESFDQGAVIRPTGGSRFLAIPTENAPRFVSRGKGRRRVRITPDNFGRGELQFVRLRNGTRVLVAVRGTRRSRATGEFSGFKNPSQAALRSGKGLATVVMFILVPVVKIPKKLDVQKIADVWGIRHIDLLEDRYR